MSSPSKMASDDEEITVLTDGETSPNKEITVEADKETSPNKVNQGDATTTNVTSDDEDSMEMDMGSFIRVRSEGDGIFEDDDDDDEFDDYSQLDSDPVCDSPPSRKRKQEMNARENELIELDDEPEFHMGYLEPDIFQMRRRDRMPLYLLNPDDYAREPKKQIQIRRAIITYRHHQEKKAQIIRLTEESKKLREHVDVLRAKVLELAGCGCRKNKLVNLDVLDVKIPIVPPRMYIRGNRPILAVPYNKHQIPVTNLGPSSCLNEKKQQLLKSFDPPPCPIKVPDVPKPLVNIASNRLHQITSTTLSSVNVGSTMSPSVGTHILVTGNRLVSPRVPQRVTNFLQKNASGGETTKQVKTEPGTISNQSSGPMTASRIIFAKGNPQPQAAPQTASQMLFASKQNAALKANPQYRLSVSQRPPLVPTPVPSAIPINRLMPPLKPGVPMGVVSSIVRTASGQVLRVVQAANPVRAVPGPSRFPVPRYQPILPKPEPSNEVKPPLTKQITKEDLKHMWSRFDDDDEDELAIIAAINGRSPSPEGRSTSTSKNARKQTMGRRESFEDELEEFEIESSSGNYQVIRANDTEIEFNKYADIVFEEAD